MTQETVNILLAILVAAMPILTLVLQKTFARNKDSAEYSADLLKITNDATEALRKAREELTAGQDAHEKSMDAARLAHDAALAAIRAEYDGKHARLKSRLEELEKVQKIYMIQLELSTHPNVQVTNVHAQAKDDTNASQRSKAIINPPSEPKNP